MNRFASQLPVLPARPILPTIGSPVAPSARYLVGTGSDGPRGTFFDRVMSDIVGSTVGAAAGIGNIGSGLIGDVVQGDFGTTRDNANLFIQGFKDTSPLVSLARGDLGDTFHRLSEYPVSGPLDLIGAGSLGFKGARRGAVAAVRSGANPGMLRPFGFKQLSPETVGSLPRFISSSEVPLPAGYGLITESSNTPISFADGSTGYAGQFKGSRMQPSRDIVETPGGEVFARPSQRVIEYTKPQFADPIVEAAHQRAMAESDPVFAERAALEPVAWLGDRFGEIIGKHANLTTPLIGYNAKKNRGFVTDISEVGQRLNQELGNINGRVDELYDQWQSNDRLVFPSIKPGASREEFAALLPDDPAWQAYHRTRSMGARDADTASKIIDGTLDRELPEFVSVADDGHLQIDSDREVFDRTDLHLELKDRFEGGGQTPADAALFSQRIIQGVFGDNQQLSRKDYVASLNKNRRLVTDTVIGGAKDLSPDKVLKIARNSAAIWSLMYPRTHRSKNRASMARSGRVVSSTARELTRQLTRDLRAKFPAHRVVYNHYPQRASYSGVIHPEKELEHHAKGSNDAVVGAAVHAALSKWSKRTNDPDSPFSAVNAARGSMRDANFLKRTDGGVALLHPSYVQNTSTTSFNGKSYAALKQRALDVEETMLGIDKFLWRALRDESNDTYRFVHDKLLSDPVMAERLGLFLRKDGARDGMGLTSGEFADVLRVTAKSLRGKKMSDADVAEYLSDVFDSDFGVQLDSRNILKLLQDDELAAKHLAEAVEAGADVYDEVMLAYPRSSVALQLEIKELANYEGQTPSMTRAAIRESQDSINDTLLDVGKRISDSLQEANHFHEPVNFGVGRSVTLDENGVPVLVWHEDPDVVVHKQSDDVVVPEEYVSPAEAADSRDPNQRPGETIRSPARRLAEEKRYAKYLDAIYSDEKVNSVMDAVDRAISVNADMALKARSKMRREDLEWGDADQIRWSIGMIKDELARSKDVAEDGLSPRDAAVARMNAEFGTSVDPNDVRFLPMKFRNTARRIRGDKDPGLPTPRHAVGPHNNRNPSIGDRYYMYATGNFDSSHRTIAKDLFNNSTSFQDRQFSDHVKDLGPVYSKREFLEMEDALGEKIPLHTDLSKRSLRSQLVAVPNSDELFSNERMTRAHIRRWALENKGDMPLSDFNSIMRQTDEAKFLDKLDRVEYLTNSQLEDVVNRHTNSDGIRVMPRVTYNRLLAEVEATRAMHNGLLRAANKYGKQVMLHWRFPSWLRNNISGSFGSLLISNPKHAIALARTIPNPSSKFSKSYMNYLRAIGIKVTDSGTSFLGDQHVLDDLGGIAGTNRSSWYTRGIEALNRWNTIIADEPFRLARLHGAISEIADDIVKKNGGKMPPGIDSIEDLWRVVGDDPKLRTYAIERTLGDMINFSDMTRFEREYISTFITFYPWLKGSWKLGMRMMQDRPELFAAMSNLSEYGVDEFEKEYGEYIPEYLKGAMLAPKALREATGIEDLILNAPGMNPLESPADLALMGASMTPLPDQFGGPSYRRYGGENLLNSLNPALRIGVGGLTGRNLFMGTPKPRDEGAGWSMAKEAFDMVPFVRPVAHHFPWANQSPAKITEPSTVRGVANWLGVPVQEINPGMMWKRAGEEREERGL